MNNQAFNFSLESALCILFLAIVCSSAANFSFERPSKMLDDLYVLQKQHDILKYWLKKGNFDLQMMSEEFAFAFPSTCGDIKVNGKSIQVNDKFCWNPKNAITESAELIGKKTVRIELTVYR